MDPDVKYIRLLQGLELNDHESHSALFKDQKVRGVLGVNLNKMNIGERIGAYFSDLFGRGEIVKSASGDTAWYVPKKSIEAFRDRYNKAHNDSTSQFIETTIAEFIKNHESENIQGLKDFVKEKWESLIKRQVYNEVRKRLTDFTYAEGPIAEAQYSCKAFKNTQLEALLDLQETFLQARRGNSQAQFNLAEKYNSPELKIFLSETMANGRAFKWYKKAAEQGHREAQYCLARCYYVGVGTDKRVKAFEWLKKAAENGHDKAQIQLGVCYQFGHGVRKNEKKAFEWYEKAAKQELPIAMNNLATCYRDGIGTEQDLKKAIDGYRAASIKGNGNAMYNLAHCYEKGLGVEKNESIARQWYHKAFEPGVFRGEDVDTEEDFKEAFEGHEDEMGFNDKLDRDGVTGLLAGRPL